MRSVALEQYTPVVRIYWEVITPVMSYWLDLSEARPMSTGATALHRTSSITIVPFPSPGLRESYRRAREDVQAGRVHSFETADDLNAWLES